MRLKRVVMEMGLACVLATGCATPERLHIDKKAVPGVAGAEVPGPVVPEARTELLDRMEKSLSDVKSEEVIVPTATLRKLIARQKKRDERCKSNELQLRALKSIDAETATPKESDAFSD